MAIPHHFPSLTEGPQQAVLISGTGLSTPNAPTVDALKGRLDEVAQGLGVIPNGNFYEIAEAVLKKLVATGKSDSESHLLLAEDLGMLDDRRWFGEIGLPLSGNTPRHRALARFAVEKRLRAIVSLNWDTLLEAALDSVGLAESARSPRPWEVTAHARVVEDKHIPLLASPHVFPVIKPHGCVRNLEQARREYRSTGIAQSVIFKLTKSALGSLLAEQKTLIDTKVQGYVSDCPLIAIGWSAGEDYLRNAVATTAKAVQRTEPDAFTLVDLCWNQNHTEIAIAYGKDEAASFAKVRTDAPLSSDCLFQWLQARHALNRLIAVAQPPQDAPLKHLLQQLDQPDCGHAILDWVDTWLPTWVRLCWRAGVMRGIDPHTNQTIEPWDVPVMPRDVHVPLGGMTVDRRELKAAAKLLVVLGGALSRFNFEMFPGGFWDAETRNLYIPLPGWRRAEQLSDLAALKPLTEALRSLGFVRNILLVWLDTEDTLPNQAYREQLAAQVRRLMPLANFAILNALSWVDLEALKGGSHAAVA